MTGHHPPDPATVVSEAVEGTFATVDEVRRRTLSSLAAAVTDGRTLTESDVRGLAPAFVELLETPGQLAVGLGIVLEPGTLPGHPPAPGVVAAAG